MDYVERIACEWREFIREQLPSQKREDGETPAPPLAGGLPAQQGKSEEGQRLKLPDTMFPGEFVPWFRGVTDSGYALEPSLLRDDGDDVMSKYNKTQEQIKQVETYMLRRFRWAGEPMANLADTREINWIYLMQHYGLQTRLLDWSKNALTALYFALRKHDVKGRDKVDRQDKDAAVWVLNPRRLNYACGLGWSIIDPADKRETLIGKYLRLELDPSKGWYPLPLIPSHVNPRLSAQHSRFTFHTDTRDGLITFAKDAGESDKCWHLVRIIIPRAAQPRILRALRLFGITQPEITPGLDSLAVEIRQRMTLGVDDLSRKF